MKFVAVTAAPFPFSLDFVVDPFVGDLSNIRSVVWFGIFVGDCPSI